MDALNAHQAGEEGAAKVAGGVAAPAPQQGSTQDPMAALTKVEETPTPAAAAEDSEASRGGAPGQPSVPLPPATTQHPNQVRGLSGGAGRDGAMVLDEKSELVKIGELEKKKGELEKMVAELEKKKVGLEEEKVVLEEGKGDALGGTFRTADEFSSRSSVAGGGNLMGYVAAAAQKAVELGAGWLGLWTELDSGVRTAMQEDAVFLGMVTQVAGQMATVSMGTGLEKDGLEDVEMQKLERELATVRRQVKMAQMKQEMQSLAAMTLAMEQGAGQTVAIGSPRTPPRLSPVARPGESSVCGAWARGRFMGGL